MMAAPPMLGHVTRAPVLFCAVCDLPILVFGRLKPCLHFFCARCARRMGACAHCGVVPANVDVIAVTEAQRGQLHFSPDACLFLTRQDLSRHIRETVKRDWLLRWRGGTRA